MSLLVPRLKDSPLFRGVSEEGIAPLLEKISYTIRRFECREHVFATHQQADAMAILLEGFVTEQKVNAAGNAVNITRHDVGELVAHAAIFLPEGAYYSANYCACKGCVAMLLHREQLLRLFSLEPRIQANFLSCISRDYAVLDEKVELLSLPSIQRKIAFYLLHEAESSGSPCVKLDFSKKMWAEFLNVPRTSLARELRSLKERGVISFSGQRLTILDPDFLHKLLQGDEPRACA